MFTISNSCNVRFRVIGSVNTGDPLENTYDTPWGSIVMSASAVATSVLDRLTHPRQKNRIRKSDIDSNKSVDNAVFLEKKKYGVTILEGENVKLTDGNEDDEEDSDVDIDADILTNFYAEYVCLSLNLFATCMTSRDSHNIANDTPIIGAIVGVVVCTVAPLRAALGILDSTKTAQRRIHEEEWLIRPLVTALNCLEICISKVGYLAAFKECEGLGPITDIIEIFGNNVQLLPNLVGTSTKSLLDSAFALLCDVASNTRRTASGPTESGIQVLYKQYFSKLCCHVFRTPFKDLKSTWSHLLVLIRLAIDAEPAFLAQFLRSTYAVVLSDVLKKSVRSSILKNNAEILLMPIARLAGSMCITPDGLGYVIENNMLPFVVEILVDNSLVQPQGDGLSSDTVARYFIQYLQIFSVIC